MASHLNLVLATIATILLSLHSANARGPSDYPTANLSTTWFNNRKVPQSLKFTDGSFVSAVLLRGTFGPRFACGFFSNGTCDDYFFACFIVQTNSANISFPDIGFPQLVWAANRNRPVGINATLTLTADGNLVLKDGKGTQAWSTNTAGKSVQTVNLTDSGNLILVGPNNKVVWQSFDHPTDALVSGQKLVSGHYLRAGVSKTDFSNGAFWVSVNDKGFFAFRGSNKSPEIYFHKSVGGKKLNKEASYVKFQNGSLALYVHSAEPSPPDSVISLPQAASAQYLKLGPDGHMRLFEWLSENGWQEKARLF